MTFPLQTQFNQAVTGTFTCSGSWSGGTSTVGVTGSLTCPGHTAVISGTCNFDTTMKSFTGSIDVLSGAGTTALVSGTLTITINYNVKQNTVTNFSGTLFQVG